MALRAVFTKKVVIVSAFLSSFLTAPTAGAQAADLRVMYAAGSPTLDPQWSYQPSFRPLRTAVYESLVTFDKDGKPAGLLAESFRVVDDLTWEFKLRPGVVFSDGTPLTVEDIPFSFARTASLKDGPSPLVQYLRTVQETKIIDERTIQVKLNRPNPFLWYDLTLVQILSKKHAEGVPPSEFNANFQKYAVGTGPFKVATFIANGDYSLVRNERYWGEKPAWDKVTVKVSPVDATRVAALLAGDADVIENIPYTDLDRLRANQNVALSVLKTFGLAWFQLPGSEKALKSGTILDMDGRIPEKNPLADVRVREAMMLAINAPAITERIYRGLAISSGQYVRSENPQANPQIKGWTYDETKARALLEQSGWANRFKVVLMGTPTGIPEAQKVMEAIAQSWSKIGVKTDVQIVPSPVYFQKRNAGETSIVISQYVPSSPDGEQYIINLMNSFQPAIGRGFFNFYDYRNPRIDALIDDFMKVNDEAGRMPLAVEAMKLALEDRTVIPLWHYSVAHGTRKDLEIVPKSSGSGFRLQDVVAKK